MTQFKILGLALATAIILQGCGGKSNGHAADPQAPATPTAPDLVDPPLPSGPAPVDSSVTPRQRATTPANDAQVLTVLHDRCQACHNPQNPMRWDLSVLPSTPAQWTEIKRRVELDAAAPGHMPLGGTLAPAEKSLLVDWLAAQLAPPPAGPPVTTVTPVQRGGPTPVVTPVTPGPVDARLSVRLRTSESQLVADASALSILQTRCQTCHNPQNPPRWDLTMVPDRAYWGEIQRRINLEISALNHMPQGVALAAAEQSTLNQWLVEQQNPPASDPFAGYTVTATDVETQAALAVGTLDQGRARVTLGPRRLGSTVQVQIAVTGADGLTQTFPSTGTVAANGEVTAEVTVAHRDLTPPAVTDAVLRVSHLGATTVTIAFTPATDDRPASALMYQVYRSDLEALDSLDDIDLNGAPVSNAFAAAPAPAVVVSGLEASHAYFFNVIARDRTGNKSVYQKLRVLTLPTNICNEVALSGGIQAWRDNLAHGLDHGNMTGSKVAAEVNRCFPTIVPQCVQRTLAFAQKDDLAPGSSDGNIDNAPQKRPPDEIKDIQPGKYWIPDNIEQIAQQKGWTAVRYKSRHAGGFDSGTPNLLMVYVPGDKVNPPVSFDRWLNFPLPKDDDEPASGLAQHPRPKFGPPKREEYTNGNGASFPSTFTMVSQDRAVNGKPATVYFQMFSRTSGAAFVPRSSGSSVDLGGCVSCHPNGLRAISPLGYHVRDGEERLNDEDWLAVDLINRKMIEGAGFKAALWGDGVVAGGGVKPLYRAERGPIMGPAKPLNGISRTREFIMGGAVNGQQVSGCYKRHNSISLRDIFSRRPGSFQPNYQFQLSANPSIDPDKVIAAMTCEGCHVNGQRWPINDRTGLEQIQFKILVDQSMPLGKHMNPLDPANHTGQVVDDLTADERFALMNCLEAEFELEKTKAFSWMTQEQCQQ